MRRLYFFHFSDNMPTQILKLFLSVPFIRQPLQSAVFFHLLQSHIDFQPQIIIAFSNRYRIVILGKRIIKNRR